ncbi:hypothetical protein ECDEC8B_0317 [Escherichia coli DEC8B]|nr:hypothetical protein ECDEC8B_0317 [Escherichia coli DEC8B]
MQGSQEVFAQISALERIRIFEYFMQNKQPYFRQLLKIWL